MPAWVHFVFFCAAINACKSSPLSCENGNVLHQQGAALLQGVRVSKSLRVATDEKVKVKMQPLTEPGYNATKKKCCTKAMGEFIDALAISMGYKICNPGFGAGLAHWHNCTDTEPGATSTFQDLKNSIDEWSEKPCSTITSASVCPDRTGCPVFQPQIDEFPACEEVCSKRNSVTLDFASATVEENNLGGQGPTTGPEELTFKNIGSFDSRPFNMVVTAGRNYFTVKPGDNGLYEPNDNRYVSGGITMNAGYNTGFDFKFKFMDGSPAKLPEFHFTIWDIDASATSQEKVTVEGFSNYVIDADAEVEVTNEDPSAKVATFSKVTSTGTSSLGVTMDGTNLVLDEEARKSSVMMVFTNTSEFRVRFIKTNTGNSEAGNSMMMINGASSLEDHCGA